MRSTDLLLLLLPDLFNVELHEKKYWRGPISQGLRKRQTLPDANYTVTARLILH